MPALESDLRRQLESVIIQARDVAEGAARSALQKRAVDAAEPFSHFGPKEKELRTRLRARGRQASDVRNTDKTQSIDQLTQELAYEFWHRMLFARFLAENHLLMHPDGVAVSLEECEELAKDAVPPAPNGFVLAARYASTMLPQIFRVDDVLLEIDFSPEQRLALERLLASLPQKTFLADDSLGWVYQFWQSKKKEEVNKSGDKIDGRTLSAVTQLFTEHYMVQFLLHNTIGAWWCSRHSVQGLPGGAGVPAGKSPVDMEYLRWRDDGSPAAGEFEGWPKALIDFKILDPCCGSGHFLGAAFNLLVPLRMCDEKLTAGQACEAVLRQNLFGLELDPRCTQIAAFALALAAWKYPNAGGYRPLPALNIACSGQDVTGKKDEWLELADGNERLGEGMDRLYDLFKQAPHLGSLIDPRREKGDLFGAGFAELQPLLAKALKKNASEMDLIAVCVAAQGITRAAELLADQYTLIITNVPYLGRSKQIDVMKEYLEDNYSEGKADLATAFVLRCLDLCESGGSAALVTPQNWLFLTTYRKLRESLLTERTWNVIARLGPRSFETISGEVVNVSLLAISAGKPKDTATLAGVDVSELRNAVDKAAGLAGRTGAPIQITKQADQLRHPDAKIAFGKTESLPLLSHYASAPRGIVTGDREFWVRQFWEIQSVAHPWRYLQGPVDTSEHYAGRSTVINWSTTGRGMLRPGIDNTSYGRHGVAVSQIGNLPCTMYSGELYDNASFAIVPNEPANLPALAALCFSADYQQAVRHFNQKLSVDPSHLINIPFDLDYWKMIAEKEYPNGIPKPQSDDPTQWLFKGDIATCTEPLQVAASRLLGYRWPEQPSTPDAIDKLADTDGIICLPGVRGEAAAAEQLLEVLHAAYGKNWSDSVLHNLLTNAGCKAGTTLDDWLRNQFFEQHYKRFHNRPFIWHIWDGRKEGFAALVNYHKFDHKALENLTFSYLGDWITAQGKSDRAGADSRLGAAQELQSKLKLILAGEPPYDIFVRWKPLHEQAIGWNPDLNDGVRMNIRPFVEAGVLRKNPNIKWTKDRGKEPDREKVDCPWFWSGKEFVGDRVNDLHLTNAEKQAARSRKKGAK